MKKLKDLLKESNVWNRQFGQKLPTLADVTKAYNDKKKINETIPALGKEWKDLDKACYALEKAVQKLAKGAGRVDRKHQKDVLGLWKYTESNIEKFKELVSKEILSKLQ
jgi:predicted RNase H-like nuclease (RuvC/YqgF family)